MNTKENTAPVAVVSSDGRRCYCFIISVSGRLWSLAALEWWSTEEHMIHEAAAMSAAARIFRHSAAVAVYELRTDDHYHLAHCCDMQINSMIPASFHRYNVPVIRRQSTR